MGQSCSERSDLCYPYTPLSGHSSMKIERPFFRGTESQDHDFPVRDPPAGLRLGDAEVIHVPAASLDEHFDDASCQPRGPYAANRTEKKPQSTVYDSIQQLIVGGDAKAFESLVSQSRRVKRPQVPTDGVPALPFLVGGCGREKKNKAPINPTSSHPARLGKCPRKQNVYMGEYLVGRGGCFKGGTDVASLLWAPSWD
ncbi:hypothetical protein K474DRAFT_1672816 [Panus rudis PR-1116 ss-1]|nr:hypothetical protein K474DRAFT_1672816 [Panus rudis PR-1116 ss-1]